MESIGKLFEKILQHYERKEYDAAEELLDGLLASHPNFHRAWFMKAVVLEETGREADAERYYEKSGNRFTLWFRLALQLRETDPERALRYLDKVVQYDPKSNLAWFSKGMLSEKLGRLDEARACFGRLSPGRDIFSRIVIPAGFMAFLIFGAIMMIQRGEKTLVWFVIASAIFCLFWLKRDAGTALQMLRKKNQYK